MSEESLRLSTAQKEHVQRLVDRVATDRRQLDEFLAFVIRDLGGDPAQKYQLNQQATELVKQEVGRGS